MIRHIQSGDIGWLVKLANEFSMQYIGKPVSNQRCTQMMSVAVHSGVALRSNTGAIVGIIMDDPYYEQKHLVELGWFAPSGDGLRLLRAFEKAGEDAGVDSIRMTTLQNSPQAAQYLLERRGYTPLERSWGLTTGDT